MTKPAALLAAALLAAAPAAAQVVVSALARGELPVEEAGELALLRYGATAADPGPVAVGTALAAGDLLSGGAGEAPAPAARLQVELTCSGGSRLWLAAPFRLQALAAAAGGGCAVDLLAGEVEVFAVGGVAVRSGGLAVAGTRGRYAVRVEAVAAATGSAPAATGSAPAAAGSAAPGLRQRVLVFEGGVRVEGPGGEAQVAAGRVLTVEAPRGRPELAVMAESPLGAGEGRGVGEVAERQARLPAPPAVGDEPRGTAPAPAPGPAAPAAAPAPAGPPAAVPDGSPGPAAPPAPAPEPAAPAAAPAPDAVPLPPPPDRDELRRWLAEKRYGAVAEALEPLLSGGALTSVDYYLLAEAYAGLQRWDRSTSYASRALRLDEIDDQLTSRELAAAQNLARRAPRSE